ncbi:MAG: hypothetical protein KDB27_32925, partial [Planctomycetales bacterium]|nr:hypothetical protein [Planctomycetales bacterium]
MTSGTAMRSRVRRRLFESLEPRKMLSATDGDLESIPLPLNAAADEVFGEFGEALIPIDEGKIPLLHSFPEAQTKVFLDFDGNFELSWSDATHVVTPPYDIDGRPDSFGSGEQERIVEIWRRVAEDYAPFQIDVTTEDPSDHVTELNEVDASIKRIRTFYFRREFDITDPADVRNLRVHLLRDDGAAVYLNGTQVVRDNLGLNARFDDFATSGSSGSDEQTYHQFPVDETLLVHGRNVIAVEVHQRSDDSSDTSFDLQLTANVGGQPSSDVIPRQSEWAYLDDGSDQGTAWSSADFNDGNWPVGRGEFGYGDMTATTQVAIGGSSADWYDGQSGGVALLNSFRSGDSAVAFVFSRSLSNVTKRIAEAASHEAGHTFGLTHQATFDESGEKIDDYNRGGNGWAPIMGVAYDEEISTWSNGPTSSVNNTQDNMAVIAQRGGGYRRDDHGDLASNATALTDLIGDNGDFEISGVL